MALLKHNATTAILQCPTSCYPNNCYWFIELFHNQWSAC